MYQASGPSFDPIVDVLSDGKKYSHITTLLGCFLIMSFADDSEKGFYDSDEDSEENYNQQKQIDFVDLAARPSAVRAEVSAKNMLETKSALLRADGKRVYYNPLQKTIEEMTLRGLSVPSSCISSPGWLFGQMWRLIS